MTRSAQSFIILAISWLATTAVVEAQLNNALIDSTGDVFQVREMASIELGVGMMSTTIAHTYPMHEGDNTDATIRETNYAYSLGAGGRIPLKRLEEDVVVWLNPNLMGQLTPTTINSGSTVELHLDIAAPVLITMSYGAVRSARKKVFGAEAGLGLNLAWRSSAGSFSLAPCASIDLFAAPKKIYRLRFLLDLIPGIMTDGRTFRTNWSLSFCLGFPT